MELLFFWRSMGPYHAARMKALAARPEVAHLRVVERFPSDPERAWTVDRSALGEAFEALSWERALRADDWSAFDAAVFPGWHERDFLRFGRRLPEGCLRVVYSVSCEHDRPRQPWREWVKRRVVGRFDGALAAGKLAADYLEKLGMPRGRIAEVGNAADPAPFEAARASRLSGEPRPGWMAGLPERFVLFAGRLSPEKNVEALLRAFERAAGDPALADWGLAVAGSGPVRLEPARPERVFLLGETPPERLAPLMARCEFLALPSLREPWGLVANEAMSAGRPVLLSPACGCLPELGKPEAAWTAGGCDAGSLAEALLRAARSNARDVMGEAALRLAREHSPERFAEKAALALVRLRGAGG